MSFLCQDGPVNCAGIDESAGVLLFRVHQGNNWNFPETRMSENNPQRLSTAMTETGLNCVHRVSPQSTTMLPEENKRVSASTEFFIRSRKEGSKNKNDQVKVQI